MTINAGLGMSGVIKFTPFITPNITNMSILIKVLSVIALLGIAVAIREFIGSSHRRAIRRRYR